MLLRLAKDVRDGVAHGNGGRPLRRFPLTLAENSLLGRGSSCGRGSGSAIWTARINQCQ